MKHGDTCPQCEVGILRLIDGRLVCPLCQHTEPATKE